MPQFTHEIYSRQTDTEPSRLIQTIVVPWTIETFRAELTVEHRKRENASIQVGPHVISMIHDPASGMPDQIAAWGNTVQQLKDRESQADVVYTNPETGVPSLLTRAEVFRVCDCIAWYIDQCGRVKLALYTAAATQGLDALELAMRSDVPNNPWPQREFDLIPQ